jgi:hypothetical protein
MPVNKMLEQKQLKANSAGKPELKARGQKAQGTRFGTLADWREGSFKRGVTVGRYSRALRDGQ